LFYTFKSDLLFIHYFVLEPKVAATLTEGYVLCITCSLFLLFYLFFIHKFGLVFFLEFVQAHQSINVQNFKRVRAVVWFFLRDSLNFSKHVLRGTYVLEVLKKQAFLLVGCHDFYRGLLLVFCFSNFSKACFINITSRFFIIRLQTDAAA